MTSAKRSAAGLPPRGRELREADRLTQLAEADRTELQDVWLETFGRRQPVRLSRELLVLALSYHLQCGRSVGLSPAEMQELGLTGSDWIAGVELGGVKGRSGGCLRSDRSTHQGKADTATGTSPAKQRPSPRPVRRSIKPGTRLLRAWQGQTHEVIAESSGQFLYDGKTYRSLSAIARAITGTRWSGPVFFGIATRSQAQKTAGGKDA